jgi:hypothetical protein
MHLTKPSKIALLALDSQQVARLLWRSYRKKKWKIQRQPSRKRFYSRNMVQEWIVENESELGSNLEWFDSRDLNGNAEVIDENGI